MAKRANPYREDFVQQSKVHVGIKQFNNNEDRLKKVYEKTLQLLFKGAKKSIAKETANDLDVSHSKKDGMKQLSIGNDGTLLYSGIVVEDIRAFQRCSCGAVAGDSHCAYCERTLCISCQHQCALCDRAHCAKCSIVRYEGAEVCVSCYG